MRISSNVLSLCVVPGTLAVVLASCADDAPASGTVRGLAVDASQNPLEGARVVLDEQVGAAGLTDARGAFTLDDVSAGPHTVHVLHNEARQAASLDIEMPADGVLVLEPVMLRACEGAGDLEPCTWLEGKPVLSRGLIDVLELDMQNGFVGSESLAVSGERSDGTLFVKFSVAGDFGDGNQLLLTDPDSTQLASLLSLTDLTGVHFYVLERGVIDVKVTRDDAGHSYRFDGTDLVFLYTDWNGASDPTYTIEVGALTLAGRSSP